MYTCMLAAPPVPQLEEQMARPAQPAHRMRARCVCMCVCVKIQGKLIVKLRDTYCPYLKCKDQGREDTAVPSYEVWNRACVSSIHRRKFRVYKGMLNCNSQKSTIKRIADK
eukprot:1160690-Pelagomonas_calceolata.AAC.16